MSKHDLSKENDKIMDVDELLADVDKFGCFHYVQFFWIGIPIIFTAMMNANYVFVAENIDYRCRIPECDTANSSLITTWWSNNSEQRCSRPVLNSDYDHTIAYDTCSNDMFTNVTEPCGEWVFAHQNSFLEEFNMACKPWIRTLVGTIHNIGMLVSMPLLGFVSDRFGRKVSIIASVVGGGCSGVIKSFMTIYPAYLSFEFLEATFGAATYTSTFVLLVELGGKDKRVVSSAYSGIYISFGEIAFALISIIVPYWRTLIRITYTPTLIFVFYVFTLSESIRWQLVNGKTKQAKATILKIAKKNGVLISEEKLAYLDKAQFKDMNNNNNQKHFEIKDLFSSTTIIKRLAITSFWWLSAGFIYYSLMINSVGLPGNKYVNFILSSAVSIPGDLIALFTLNIFGRKKMCMFFFILCGASCVISGVIPESLWWLGILVFLLGKMAVAACFNCIYIYSSELFPTNMRNSLMGFCSMWSSIGCIAAPQTPLLVSISPSLPLILFGAFAVSAGLLVTLTPETLNKKLPDTVADIEGPTQNELSEIK